MSGNVGRALALAGRAAPAATVAYVALTVAAGVSPVAVAWQVRRLFDGITAGAPASTLIPLAGGIAALGVLTGSIPVARDWVRGILTRRVALVAADRLYQAVNRIAGLARMEQPAFRDQLRMAQQGGRSAPAQLLDAVLTMGQSTITVVGFLATLLTLGPAVAVVVLAAAVPALAAQLRLSRSRTRTTLEMAPRERREFHYSELLTSLAAAKELRLLGLGDLFRGRMLTELAAANAADGRQINRETRVQGALQLLTAVVSGGSLVWAIVQAAAGRLSIGDVSLFLAALGGTQSGLGSMVERVGVLQRASLLFDYFRQVELGGPDLAQAAAPRPVPALRHGIELRDVWFRYGPDKPWVLRGVDLFIPYGKAVALLGRNGSGKSSLIKLLCRFYDPTRGVILWDGQDIRTFAVGELRARIGAVFQDFMSYELTAAENIGVGDLTALNDRPRIEEAAGRAGVHETLAALPRGYDTLLSRMFFDTEQADGPDTGVVLSGGQEQRVALARAFLRDRERRDLMILDEPSAGLDAVAEHEVHTRLRRHRQGVTSVLISHRLGTIRDADTIIVLTAGVVGEQGTHPELMAANGPYAEMFRLQADGYQLEPATP